MNIELPNNALLQSLVRHSVRDLAAAIIDREEEILADIQATREELEEGKPLVFGFSFSGKLLLDKSKIETAFGYAVKKTSKAEHQIAAPSEPELWEGEE